MHDHARYGTRIRSFSPALIMMTHAMIIVLLTVPAHAQSQSAPVSSTDHPFEVQAFGPGKQGNAAAPVPGQAQSENAPGDQKAPTQNVQSQRTPREQRLGASLPQRFNPQGYPPGSSSYSSRNNGRTNSQGLSPGNVRTDPRMGYDSVELKPDPSIEAPGSYGGSRNPYQNGMGVMVMPWVGYGPGGYGGGYGGGSPGWGGSGQGAGGYPGGAGLPPNAPYGAYGGMGGPNAQGAVIVGGGRNIRPYGVFQ